MRLLFRFLSVPLAGLFAGCGHPKPAPDPETHPPIKAEVSALARMDTETHEEVAGTVVPRISATIEAKVTGRVVEIPVVAGSRVAAGDLLARLDAAEIEAQHRRAVALRDQASRDVKRYEEMTDRRAVSAQELDAARSRLEVAGETVAEAESRLAYTSITAPFAGVITRKLADVGDLLTPGKALVEMEDPSLLRFEADLPEALVERVSLGSPVRVQVDSLGRSFDALTSEVAPSADRNTRTFTAKFDLQQTEGLRAGQFGRVLVPVGKTPRLLAPRSSVVRRGQFELVFVMDSGIARLRLVKTGKPFGEKIEIVSGLSADERVITRGADRMVDGQRVEEVRP